MAEGSSETRCRPRPKPPSVGNVPPRRWALCRVPLPSPERRFSPSWGLVSPRHPAVRAGALGDITPVCLWGGRGGSRQSTRSGVSLGAPWGTGTRQQPGTPQRASFSTAEARSFGTHPATGTGTCRGLTVSDKNYTTAPRECACFCECYRLQGTGVASTKSCTDSEWKAPLLHLKGHVKTSLNCDKSHSFI